MYIGRGGGEVGEEEVVEGVEEEGGGWMRRKWRGGTKHP